MEFKTLDSVVLNRNLPDLGLRQGDLGAVVEAYGSDALEVEFVTASGRTQAVATLTPQDVRLAGDDELITVRPATRGAA